MGMAVETQQLLTLVRISEMLINNERLRIDTLDLLVFAGIAQW